MNVRRLSNCSLKAGQSRNLLSCVARTTTQRWSTCRDEPSPISSDHITSFQSGLAKARRRDFPAATPMPRRSASRSRVRHSLPLLSDFPLMQDPSATWDSSFFRQTVPSRLVDLQIGLAPSSRRRQSCSHLSIPAKLITPTKHHLILIAHSEAQTQRNPASSSAPFHNTPLTLMPFSR